MFTWTAMVYITGSTWLEFDGFLNSSMCIKAIKELLEVVPSLTVACVISGINV